MNQGELGFAYNPLSPFSTPFTIISQVRQMLTSKPMSLPCLFEVYCPYSCKKIKIGLTKDNKVQAMQFNTTTNRTVTFYANENIRYLINKFRPNKKDKKNITGNDWACYVDVEDKGNIAIFNPYCIDPLQPLSFYTFTKIGSNELPNIALNFQPRQERSAVGLFLAKKPVYMTKDLKWIGPNKYFSETSLDNITVTNPTNPNEELTMPPKKLITLVESFLAYYYGQLQKIYELENKGIQFNENFKIVDNIDVIYEKISFYLNILEQIRARFMNDSCSSQYRQMFPDHPRLYSSFQRLSSFLNYGNTKYDVVKLAEFGFYNRSDMLQDISYIQIPQQEIPSAEEQNVKNEQQLRRKLFPFARLTRGLPFPNVGLNCSLSSMHCQKVSQNEVVDYSTTDPYIAFIDQKCKVTLWSCQMMIYKMIELDVSKNYQEKIVKIPISQKDKQQLHIQTVSNVGVPKVEQKDAGTTTEKKIEVQVQPDLVKLKQLQSMGFGPHIAKKALIQTKNDQIDVVIDYIYQMNNKKRPQKKVNKQWFCPTCTFKNKATADKCQMCLSPPLDQQQEAELLKQQMQQLKIEQQKKKIEQQEKLLKEEEDRKKKQEEEKAQQQKLTEAQKEQIIKNGKIMSIALYKSNKSHIDPFFISVLIQLENKKLILKTFRIGLSRKSLVKFYRVQQDFIVSNFNRQILKTKDYDSINNLLGNSRQQIQWGIKFFSTPSENVWTVIESSQIQLQGPLTQIKIQNNYIFILNQQNCLGSYEIITTDSLTESKFVLQKSDNVEVKINKKSEQNFKNIQEVIQIVKSQVPTSIIIDANIEQVCVQVVENINPGVWKNVPLNKELNIGGTIYADNLIMSQFLPLKIESFEGSIFSHKYSTTSMLQKNNDKNNAYVSNYPNVSFAFKSIENKPMLVESITVVSKNVKMNKIYPISAGLIFTANQLSWFAIAKQKFSNFTKQEYEQWLKRKHTAGETPAFWEPVAYFEVINQAEFQLNFKRIAQYVFLLPTSVSKKDNNDDVIALKIDFFGAKGRVQQELPEPEINDLYKNQGLTLNELEITEESEGKQWIKFNLQTAVIKTAVSANTMSFAPKYFENYSQKVPLSTNSVFEIKFKDVQNRKQITLNRKDIKSFRVLKSRKATCNVSKLNINSFSQLTTLQNKLSNTEIERIISNFNLDDLILQILRGPAQITHYQTLLSKILNIPSYDKKVLESMSKLLPKICETGVIVNDVGFKSFLRFYEKIMLLNENLTSDTIQHTWIQTTQFCLKTRNKNYNILRNNYKIDQLVLQPGLFSKDYYRLINPNHVDQQKPVNISAEPQTPINNRVFVDVTSNFNYIYYIDLLNHKNISSVDLYFPKIAVDNRYKMSIRIVQCNINTAGKVEEKQIFNRYFHEDYLCQLSQKSFKDTEIFTKTHINYMSIPGQIISDGTRVLKLYFNLLILTTISHNRYRPFTDPYIILPVINSQKKQELKYSENPISKSILGNINFPQSAKHNSTLERMPPHKYACEDKKYLYVVHQFKNKASSQQVKSESVNKIQKIVQNILDKNIVTETVASIRINDYAMNYKGLDFAYILMINLIKLYKKLPASYKAQVKIMLTLFETFIAYESGPIKSQTSSLLIELFNRLSASEKNTFTSQVIDNYLINSEKLKGLKIAEKFPTDKIIKFLGQIQIPVATLFDKLSKTKSLSAVTILILLISNNQAKGKSQNLDLYSEDKVVKTFKVHQLVQSIFKTSIWILNNASGLSSQILELSLNLLISLLNNNASFEVSTGEIKNFVENLPQEDLWQIVFGTLRKKNDLLNEKIDTIFKILVENITESFQKGVNNMLLQIIRKDQTSLYEKINPNITDEARMNHLQTILEYLSLTNKKIFLDQDTAISLLELPLTTTLWSLALKIIPRQDKILAVIIKKFSQQLYNSLGNEIMEFCEPLAGIRKMESNHINWLELVKKIRIQGRTIFDLFIEHLRQCNFGGKNGLTMALTNDVIKLEIAQQFSKLISENKIQDQTLTQQNIKVLISWFYMNYTKQKGTSPSTDLLFNLSKNIVTILQKITGSTAIIPKFIKIILETRKQCQVLEKLFEQKRISGSNALDMNKRFSQCFQFLINLFCLNDELFNYFAFEIQGLQYILQKSGLSSSKIKQMKSHEGQSVSLTIPQQQFLIEQGLIVSSTKDNNNPNDKAGGSLELKQEQFATNTQLVPNKNAHGVTCTVTDWTSYKKGNKSKVIFLPMNGVTHNQYPLYVSFNQPCQVRSIKIGFPAASFELNDKLVASPSVVLLEGGMDLKNMQSMGQMQQINDDGYTCNGVRVFVLNLQKIRKSRQSLTEVLTDLLCFRVKYLKVVIKRPVVTFIEGQYSPLNGKPYTNLGCSVSFLSVVGDNFQKRKLTLLNLCKQISKSSALTLLGTVINETNLQTVKRISNSEQFITNFKNKFSIIKEHMVNYPNIVPNIVYSLGSSNEQLGDWIIDKFLSEGQGDAQAKILNQIVMSSSKKIYSRLNIFLKHILNKIKQIITESDIQSNVKFSQSLYFVESFCKTLEQSYQFGIQQTTTLTCTQQNIEDIITLYDKKYSSPEIKTFSRLLINLLFIRSPLKLSEDVKNKTFNLVWQNCSQAKPYFYELLGALLINKKSKQWIQQNDHQKIKTLVTSVKKSIDSSSLKILHSEMFLLWVLSLHEKDYIRKQKLHLQLYNKIKLLVLPSFQIYEHMLKLIQNVVLDSEQEQKNIAIQLIEDVDLLVQRKDSNLQQLYVGILRLQKEVNVNLRGFDVDSKNNKKQTFLQSKILNKAHVKILNQKVNKKIKFNLFLESDSLKPELYNKVLQAMNASHLLMIFKMKLKNQKYGYFGCYCPGKAFRAEEDSYCWQDVISYEKGSFIFSINQGQTKFIQNNQVAQNMISLTGGYDEADQFLVFFEKSTEIFKLNFNNSSQTTFNLTNFNDSVLQGIEIYNGSIKPSSMQPKLLASSSKSPVPFNYYRTSNTYIFPSRVTIQKFMNLIGIKGKASQGNKKISSDQILGQIVQESNDFIIDLSILPEDSEQSSKADEGYFPTMKIFDQFSELGGVNKVLQKGSKSIKDWRKPQRRKCFEHYMSQLRNFVHLPSFFNHYIKNHQSITFLFEVASGMPDDPASQKNWQQEQVKSSKFIYKILADIYKYDKSPGIRDMKKYSEFCELILQKLAQISKQTVRSSKQEAESPQVIEKPAQAQKQKPAVNTADKKKKKGTGYSNDNQNNSSKWTAAQWLEYRKNMNEQIQRVASIFVSFLDCQKPLSDSKLSDTIKNSCLLPLIETALRSSSLLDISKQADLFKSYLNIIKSLASNPATISCLLQVEPIYKPVQTQSIFKLLEKLHRIAQVFIDCLKPGKSGNENETAAIIATQIEKTYNIVDKALKSTTKNTQILNIKQINSMPIAAAYRFLLSGLRFGYVDLKKKQQFTHFYSSTISKGAPQTAKILRLSQQLADLSSSLPCEHTNSIFVRCDRTRIDVIKILIMGSKDTPYSNGAFMFDLYCDDSYPNNPPKMSITTTGGGKIRFNPNLYSCGKVCLSLLGTWRGQASQNWDAKISTLLQLFISTQGITMSEDLYFNQPGYDSEQGTPEGEKKNQAYANIVRIGNVKYAIIDQIKNPPKGFEDVVNRHFYVKKKQILEQIQKWIELADKKEASYVGLVNDHNSSWCNELKVKGKYKQMLVKQYQELKTLLQKLPQPTLVQKQQEVNFETQKIKKKAKAKEVKLGEIDVSYQPQAEKQLNIEQNVMQDRWSRYIGAMGIQAVKKQAQSKIILIGLKSLGLQIAKNLILSGLKQICIVDQGEYGLGSEEHFYMSDIKSKKIEQCIFKIKQLNPYMLVKCQKQIPNLQGYHLVITTQTLKQAFDLSVQCRKSKVKFVFAQTCGVSGIYFSDLGQQYSVEDPNGQQPFEGMIKQITCDKEGVVKLLEGVKHPYQDGDYIVLDKVEGMKQKESKMQQASPAQIFYNKMSKTKTTDSINGKLFQIKVINWNSFSIGDTSNFQPYIKGGLCKNINIPKKLQFSPLEQCVANFDKFLDPSVGIYDFEKMGDNYSVFACFQAYSEFVQKNKKKPKNWQLKDTEQFLNILKKIVTNAKKTQQQIEGILKFGRKYAVVAQAQLPVLGAYFGGMVSQQIIKAITNKYTPIKQFFTFHFNQLLQQIPEDTAAYVNLQVKQNQLFPNLRIVIGKQNSKKIEQMKTFVIGAGAIGCELLKNFAMVNMSAEGMMTVTDPDHIQTSNLTRQFLFRQKHVKKPKSATAAATLIQMNPLLKNHISARLDRVSEQTQDIYSDQFFESQTVIANALDNVKARVFVDSRCVTNSKPLFQSGTLGPKGHVQVIIPHKTQNYGNQNDPTEENQIPHCTLKMFPEQTVHCIQWSRDIFGKVFTLNPKALKKVLQAKDLSVAQGQQKSTVLKMIQYKPNNFDDCVGEAVRKFYKYFRNNVRQLIHTYPLDLKTKDGNLFWTLPKRPPKQIPEIDFSDPVHQKFITSYAVLLAKIFGVPFPKDFRTNEGIQKIMAIGKGFKPEQFTPSQQQSKKLQKLTEKQQKANVMQEETQPQVPQQSQQKQQPEHNIQLTSEILQTEVKPEEFQKDQDSNGHIDLIYSMSNLRSRNYGLHQCTWIQAKLKAGKIMAALSTTTSVVAALQTIQIIKLVVGSKQYRNAFINLAIPLIQISEPGEVPKHKIGNTQFTVWDTWQFKAETLKDLLKQIQQKYDVQGYNISTSGGVPIYWQAMYVGKEEAAQQILTRPLNKFSQDKFTLNILIRSKGDKKPYEHVPKIVVYPSNPNVEAK